jgi:anti-sigma B factor antagonist
VVAALRPATTDLVVDLGQLTFLGSHGIRALLLGRRAAEQHGCRYRVTNPSGTVLRVLEITDLIEFLGVTEDSGADRQAAGAATSP